MAKDGAEELVICIDMVASCIILLSSEKVIVALNVLLFFAYFRAQNQDGVFHLDATHSSAHVNK